MRGRILPSMKSKGSYVLVEDDVVIGTAIQYDMIDYVKMPNMPTNLEFLKKLEIIGSKLQGNLDINQMK